MTDEKLAFFEAHNEAGRNFTHYMIRELTVEIRRLRALVRVDLQRETLEGRRWTPEARP